MRLILGLVFGVLVASISLAEEPNLDAALNDALEKQLQKVETPPVPETKAEVTASAEDQPVFQEKIQKKVAVETAQPLWLRMAISLIIVLSMAFGLILWLKRSPRFKKTLGKAPLIELLHQIPIGGRNTLAVIRVAGESVLIGISDQKISMLKSLTLLEEEAPKQAAVQARFGKTLKKALNTPSEHEEEFAMKGLKDAVRDRLRNLKEI